MTIASQATRADYVGNGVTTVFAYPFRILAATDLVVTSTDLSGNITTLVYVTNYAVSGVGSPSGGSVTLTAPLTTGYALAILRVMDVTQPTNFANLGRYFASAHERAFDRVVMLVQQVANNIGTGGLATVSTYMAGVVNQLTPSLAQAALGIGAFMRTLLAVANAAALRVLIGGVQSIAVKDFGAVGNGVTDDATAINNALTTAALLGISTVQLESLTYVYGATLHWPTKVTLAGRGRGVSILKQKAGANLVTSIAGVAAGVGQGLRDFTLDLNRANNTGAGQNYGVLLDTATDAVIDNIEVKEFYGLVGGTGVALACANTSTRCVVRNNHIHDCGDIAGLHQADGIFFSGVRPQLLNNVIDNITDTAIVSESGSDPLIQGNQINNCVQGIAVGCAGSGPMSGGSVVGNIITGTNRYNGQSILVYRFAGNATSKLIVANNVVRDSTAGAGIKIWQSSNVSVTGNVVSTIAGTNSAYNDGLGVIVRNCDHITVTGNMVSDCAANGILIDGCSNLTMGYNDVNNNMLQGAGSGAGIAIHDGPAESNAPMSVVTTKGILIGNRSQGASQGRGCTLSGTCSKFLVMGNDFRSNANDPGYINGASGNVRLMGNLFSNADNTLEAWDHVLLNGGATVAGGKFVTAISTATAGGASLGLTPGVQPTTGVNGDIWYDAGLDQFRGIKAGVVVSFLTT